MTETPDERETAYTRTDLIPAMLAEARANGIREAAEIAFGADDCYLARKAILALLDQPAETEGVTVQEAARVILSAFTSDDNQTDFKPSWEAWKKTMWAHDGSIYNAMSSFLRALSGDSHE